MPAKLGRVRICHPDFSFFSSTLLSSSLPTPTSNVEAAPVSGSRVIEYVALDSHITGFS